MSPVYRVTEIAGRFCVVRGTDVVGCFDLAEHAFFLVTLLEPQS
jgi:hypothetical protein